MDSGGPRSHASVSPSRLSNCMNQEKWPKTANLDLGKRSQKKKIMRVQSQGTLLKKAGPRVSRRSTSAVAAASRI